MKKNTIAKLQVTKSQIRRMAAKQRLTVGLDLGDRTSRYCILDEAGEKASEDKLPTTKAGLDSVFGKMPPCRIALEVGTHSPWVSRHLAAMGHEVIVANPHKVKLITQSVKKNDRMDAEQLARLARVDPKLLSPIQHRGPGSASGPGGDPGTGGVGGRADGADQQRARIGEADGRTVEEVRRRLREGIAGRWDSARRRKTPSGPLLKSVEEISKQIGEYDERIEEIAKRYPEMKLLTQVHGVGTLIALTYILTIEDAQRFEHSRDVGPYLGLTRKQRDSGGSEPELGITKAGDELLRRLLVQGAHCILRQGAPDSDLKAWGMARLQNGGKNGKHQKGSKNAKKKTIVAIARKLAVLLHRLWVTGEVYDPQYNRKAAEAAKGKGEAAA